jgi:hypothetical protein
VQEGPGQKKRGHQRYFDLQTCSGSEQNGPTHTWTESIAEIRVLPAGTGGLRNSVSFLQADPDIAVHASLLPSSSSHVFLEGLSRS